MAFLCRIYEVHRYFISYQPRSGFSVYLPHSTGHPLGDATWLAAGMCTDKQTHSGGGRRDEANGEGRYSCTLCVLSLAWAVVGLSRAEGDGDRRSTRVDRVD